MTGTRMISAAIGAALCFGASASLAAKAPAPPAAAPATAVSPEAVRLLKEMSDYLGSAGEFTFHADVLFDHVLPSGQKVQFSAGEDVALKRPGGVYVEWSGDLGDRQFWYDGTTLTLYDPSQPFYATAAAPADIDSMLNSVQSITQFAPPLADFLYSIPYNAVSGKLVYGFDVGVQSVNGKACRSLAFVEKDIDWQIWISQGPQRTPCKIVITYKGRPAQPQFSATFTDWDFAPRIAPSTFTADLPPGTRKVPFASVGEAK